jgi:hypothetical protein
MVNNNVLELIAFHAALTFALQRPSTVIEQMLTQFAAGAPLQRGSMRESPAVHAGMGTVSAFLPLRSPHSVKGPGIYISLSLRLRARESLQSRLYFRSRIVH